MPAPICLFTYNRLNETRQTLEALQSNFLAHASDLFIFSDGARNEGDKLKVTLVRQYIRSATGFKSVKINESNENKGLAVSIIQGVSQVLERYENVIVLEDDLIASPNFLNFMNHALLFYQPNSKIQSVNGYSLSLSNKTQEIYFQRRTGSWGWATWKDRWDSGIFDKDKLKNLIQTNPNILNEFKQICGADMPKMLQDSLLGKNDSWYVRWTFDHFQNKNFAAFPAYSYVTNIGHQAEATHCKGINAFVSEPVNQNKLDFNFPAFQPPDQKSTREFLHYFSLKHKIKIRIKLLKTHTGRMQLFNEFKMKIGVK